MRVHDLRHVGATLAAQAGATTKELMARIGHTTCPRNGDEVSDRRPGAGCRYRRTAFGVGGGAGLVTPSARANPPAAKGTPNRHAMQMWTRSFYLIEGHR
jgi:hypothetical protein